MSDQILVITANIPATNTDPLSNMISIQRNLCKYLNQPEDLILKLNFKSNDLSEKDKSDYDLYRLGFYVGAKAACIEKIDKAVIAFPWDKNNQIELSISQTHAKLATSKELALMWLLMIAWNKRFDSVNCIGIEDFKEEDLVSEYVRKVSSVDQFILKHRDADNQVGIVTGYYSGQSCAIAINLKNGKVAYGTTGNNEWIMRKIRMAFLDDMFVVEQPEQPKMLLS